MKKYSESKLNAFILLGVFLLSLGCASYYMDDAQVDLRNSFANRDFNNASSLLERFERENVYQPKDAVLMYLERGAVHHFSGDYENSNKFFNEAEFEIEAQFARSVTLAIQSFLINDYSLVYGGEDYEDIYLNVFKSLNYIHLEDLEAALVEARRMSFKMERLDEHYRGLAESLARQDTTNQVDWQPGEANIENSALGHYLSAVLYSKSNRPDNARIELDRTRVALTDQWAIGARSQVDDALLEKVANPDSYNMMLKGFAGRSPRKKSNELSLYIPQEDFYIKFALPSLEMWESEVSFVTAFVNDTLEVPMYLIEEMDRVAREVYKVKEPIVYARSVVRSFIKAFGSRALANRAGKENEVLGEVLNIFGMIGQEVSERADLRSWQTLPGQAYTNLIYLPEGMHSVRIEYLDDYGRLLFFEEQQLDISESRPLNIMQTLYWN
jgi:hypothetical protein